MKRKKKSTHMLSSIIRARSGHCHSVCQASANSHHEKPNPNMQRLTSTSTDQKEDGLKQQGSSAIRVLPQTRTKSNLLICFSTSLHVNAGHPRSPAAAESSCSFPAVHPGLHETPSRGQNGHQNRHGNGQIHGIFEFPREIQL